jgi:hypothetical protein
MMELSDDELEARLAELVRAEREGLREFLRHLADFDRRRIANKKAYPSTFEYCTMKLGLSADEAYRRIRVARYSREDQSVLEMIGDGRLTLTSATKLVPALKEGAGPELLQSAANKTVREVETIVAQLNPVAEAPRDVVTPLSLMANPQEPQAEPRMAYRVSITLSDEGYEKLRRATDLLRHKHPKAQPHDIVEDALEALLDAVDRERKEQPSKPRGAAAPGSRRVPEWVKDLVWKRDGGRCAFVAGDGRRCEATAFLQYDHATPFALGGASDEPGNIRLLCAAHNQLAARDAGLPASPVDTAARGE